MIFHELPLILVLRPNSHMFAVHPYLNCPQIQSNKGNPTKIGPRFKAVEYVQPILENISLNTIPRILWIMPIDVSPTERRQRKEKERKKKTHRLVVQLRICDNA